MEFLPFDPPGFLLFALVTALILRCDVRLEAKTELIEGIRHFGKCLFTSSC